MPKVVIIIDNNIEYIKVWCEYINAANLFLWPNELEINELQPATIPIPAEMIIKYNGNDFAKAAKAYAFMKRRGYVIPEDIKDLAYDVMRHRIGLTYEAQAENITQEAIIDEVLNKIIIP